MGLLARSTAELSGLAGWVADVVAALGAVGVGLLTALENLFPPIPSEVVLPLAGYLASRDRLSLVGAVVGATLGSLAGAVIMYEAAAAAGGGRLRRLLGRLPLADRDDIDRAQAWFDRHGTAAVFFGRFVPGVRSLVSIPAGSGGMSRWRFWCYTTAGSALWNLAFVLAGFALGSAWRSVGRYSGWINWAVVVAVIVVIARYVWNRRDRLAHAVARRRP